MSAAVWDPTGGARFDPGPDEDLDLGGAETMAEARALEDAELVERAVIALAREWGVTEQVARLRLAGVVAR